jgi:hypothetical protein
MDIRLYRHQGLESYETRQQVKRLANGLIERLNGFARWHLGSNKMEAQITAPAPETRVPREAVIRGTLREIPESVEIWLVVEAGTLYHPQKHLPRVGDWESAVVIGRPGGRDSNRKFAIHVFAVTEDVSADFERYRQDASKQKEWSGVSKPPDSRILATPQVVRDDSG